jgi:hypothetical protein
VKSVADETTPLVTVAGWIVALPEVLITVPWPASHEWTLLALITTFDDEVEKSAVTPPGVVIDEPPTAPVPDAAQAPNLARLEPFCLQPVDKPGVVPLLFPMAFTVIGPLFARTSENSRFTPQPSPPEQEVEVLPRPVKEIPPPMPVAKI